MSLFFPDFQNLSMFEIKTRISQLTNLGKPEQDFLFSSIDAWKQDDKYKLMITAEDYYKNEGDIKDKKRLYIDRKGIQREDEKLSNTKLFHPYMRKLTRQKVNYLLSKPFTVQTKDDKFAEALTTYFDKKFRRLLKNTGRDAVVKGIAWIQVYYDEEGTLKFKRIPSEEIIPFWKDSEHTELNAFIRVYNITRFDKKGAKKVVYKVEYCTLSGVYYYEMSDNGLIPDPDMGTELRGHFVALKEQSDSYGNVLLDEKGNTVYKEIEATWDRIPLVPFKYNADELSLLTQIKSKVDNYDRISSSLADTILDVPDSIKVVKNYDGTDKGEFTQNLATYRTAFVGEDGGVDVVNIPIDITAIEAHLTRLRKDIYDAGNGVDIQNEDLGNASGVALKYRYSDLADDVEDMANEFAAGMDELMWFIKVDMQAKGIGDYMATEYEIIFNTDMIINESDVINEAKASVGVISDETIVANHPWVTDATEELKKLKKQRAEAIQEELDMMANQDFGGSGNSDSGNGNKEGGDE